MDSLLTKIKNELVSSREESGGTLSYLPPQSIQKVAPQSLPPLRNDQFPFIGIAPVSSPETWHTNGKRQVSHTVELYCARYYTLQESSVEKSVEFTLDVLSVMRNHTLGNYLDAPIQPNVTNYTTSPYGDNLYLIVSTISLECRRLFISSVPG